MSRIIPNRKQSDEKTNIGLNVKNSTDDSDIDLPVALGLESYSPKVLFRSDDYIVIDKPHGVRMNGAFEGTASELPARL